VTLARTRTCAPLTTVETVPLTREYALRSATEALDQSADARAETGSVGVGGSKLLRHLLRGIASADDSCRCAIGLGGNPAQRRIGTNRRERSIDLCGTGFRAAAVDDDLDPFFVRAHRPIYCR